jgi:hypothetical protein
MATDTDINGDDFKSFYGKIFSEKELVDLELDWIGKLRKQIEFANKALTRFNLNLKVARKWRSWNKINKG